MNQRRRWRRGSAAAAAVLIRNVGCSTFKTRPVQLQWSCQNQNHPCIFHHVLNTLPRQAIIARDIHSPDHENRESGHHNLHRASEIRNALKNGVSYRALAVQCHRFGRPGTRPSRCAASKQQRGPIESGAPAANAQPLPPSPQGPRKRRMVQASAGTQLTQLNTAVILVARGDIARRTVGHLRLPRERTLAPS